MVFKHFLLIFFFHIYALHCKDLPPFLHVCHRNAPDLEACVTESLETLRPYVAKGVPEYNIPKLEPLELKELIKDEAMGIKIETTNVFAWGCSDYIVKSISLDTDSHIYIVNVEIPKLRIQADYSVDGKLLLVPVKGRGNMEANVTDCVTTTTLRSELYTKDGETYLRFISNKLEVKIGGGVIRLDNLFNGDKILLQAINDMVNKNFNSFAKELLPAVVSGLESLILEVANDIVGPYTMDQLLPP